MVTRVGSTPPVAANLNSPLLNLTSPMNHHQIKDYLEQAHNDANKGLDVLLSLAAWAFYLGLVYLLFTILPI